MQALFHLDHRGRGEAIFTASVLTEFDQIWDATHRANHVVELVDAVAMPVRELRHVALRERRLLMRDGVQRDRRIGDDAFAVVARDLSVQFDAVGGLGTLALDALRGRADLALRLQCDALALKAAMVDARVDIEFSHALVGKLGPAFAPALDHLGAVPVSDLPAETVFIHRTHGQHDVCMGFKHTVLGHIPMHIEIGDHAPIDEFAPNEVAGEFNALRLRQFARKGEFHFAGQLGIFPDFERLDIVPQPLAGAPSLRRMLRQHHLGMDDAAFARKIVAAVEPLVAQPRARAVGG